MEVTTSDYSEGFCIVFRKKRQAFNLWRGLVSGEVGRSNI